MTPREREVALCICEGLSYKETASRLSISIKTVKTHLAHVYEKTSCGSNVGLVLLLRRGGGKGRGSAASDGMV